MPVTRGYRIGTTGYHFHGDLDANREGMGSWSHWRRRKGRPSPTVVARTAEEILEGLSSAGELEPVNGHPSDPAVRYRYKDGVGEVGVIASVTHPFCRACNRLSSTAEGMMRTCLFSISEHDLKSLLRRGAEDEEIKEWLGEVVWTKTPGHLIGQEEFVQPARTMSAIGG